MNTIFRKVHLIGHSKCNGEATRVTCSNFIKVGKYLLNLLTYSPTLAAEYNKEDWGGV